MMGLWSVFISFFTHILPILHLLQASEYTSSFFFKTHLKIIFKHVYSHVCACMWVPVCACLWSPGECVVSSEVRITSDWELLTWVLETEVRSSARALHTLNHRTISSAPTHCFYNPNQRCQPDLSVRRCLWLCTAAPNWWTHYSSDAEIKQPDQVSQGKKEVILVSNSRRRSVSDGRRH